MKKFRLLILPPKPFHTVAWGSQAARNFLAAVAMCSIHSTILLVKLVEFKVFLALERVGDCYGYGQSIQIRLMSKSICRKNVLESS